MADGQIPYIRNGEFLGSINYDGPGKCTHPNAKSTGDTCFEGCCDYYKCPDCGRRFLVECPD
jgi:hypothetical protein